MGQNLMELQRKTDESTIIVGEFNIPLLEMDRSCRQESIEDIAGPNSTIKQLDISDIYRLLQQRNA
jgi:hypothetical protein